MARLLSYKNVARGQRVLVYGAPKSGKTAALAELAKHFKILYLDLEDGVETLFLLCDDEQLANIEYVPIRDTPTDPAALTTLLRLLEERKGWICEAHSAWKCARCVKHSDEFFQIDLDTMGADEWVIAVDSGTQFALSALNHICKANNVDISKTDDSTTFAMWRAQGAYLDKLFGFMQASSENYYVVAHELEVTMPDKTKKLAPSMGTRNYASSVGKFFGHVIRLTRSSSGHKGSSMTVTTGAEAGSRWGVDYNTASMVDFFIRPDNIEDNRPVIGAKPKIGSSPAGTKNYANLLKKK